VVARRSRHAACPFWHAWSRLHQAPGVRGFGHGWRGLRNHPTVVDVIWVAVGGAVGAAARYSLGAWIVGRVGTAFPLHTLLINVTGSLAIGVLLVVLTERLVAEPAWRLLLVVGFLGGYTTFSSYTFEVLALLEEGDWLPALWYVLGSNGLGLLAAYSGIVVARALGR
jgi:fluoride exporter